MLTQYFAYLIAMIVVFMVIVFVSFILNLVLVNITRNPPLSLGTSIFSGTLISLWAASIVFKSFEMENSIGIPILMVVLLYFSRKHRWKESSWNIGFNIGATAGIILGTILFVL